MKKFVYIIAILLIALQIMAIDVATDVRTKTLTAENKALTQRYEDLELEYEILQHSTVLMRDIIDSRTQDIEQLRNEIEQLKAQPPKVPEAQKTSRSSDRLTSLGIMDTTAYCSCEKCCGEYAKNRPGGKVYGAAGVELTPGVSVAGWLPLGTHIVIDGHEYIVQDRTAKWVREKYDGRIIDIYFDDHQAAWDWGRQQKEIFEVAG